MAATGKASKLTKDLAYSLFGKLVDYSDMYRTMQWVILNDDEAVADVLFPSDTNGTWTVPPHFIDGVISLSGFILNGGTHFDEYKKLLCYAVVEINALRKATDSWRPIRGYVRIVPTDSHSYVGDVYVLQGSEIVGVVEAIVFRQWPRVMLNRFFSPPDMPVNKASIPLPRTESITPSPPAFTSPNSTRASDTSATSPILTLQSVQLVQGASLLGSSPASAQTADVTSRALILVAEKVAVDIGPLTDEARITDLGPDPLMSLVLSQQLRVELGIEVRDVFFLGISTIRDLKGLFHRDTSLDLCLVIG